LSPAPVPPNCCCGWCVKRTRVVPALALALERAASEDRVAARLGRALGIDGRRLAPRVRRVFVAGAGAGDLERFLEFAGAELGIPNEDVLKIIAEAAAPAFENPEGYAAGAGRPFGWRYISDPAATADVAHIPVDRILYFKSFLSAAGAAPTIAFCNDDQCIPLPAFPPAPVLAGLVEDAAITVYTRKSGPRAVFWLRTNDPVAATRRVLDYCRRQSATSRLIPELRVAGSECYVTYRQQVY